MALRCEVDEHVAAARLRARHASMSDADEFVATRMAADLEPWPDAVPIATAGSPGAAVTMAVAAVRDRSHFG
ncbi:MAG TPA: hypothetical protein VFW65_17060 [Pseudonocardiaceae bacterium]|nr:hypothetical protein [Pseudonocardiaceae bacterium]